MKRGIAEMIDPLHFRTVLGAYPTGVCIIAAEDEQGAKHAMVVGSFTSISLAPPLVGFFIDIGSTTWPRIAGVGRFCVNVLGAHQSDACRHFAARGADKFGDFPHGRSPAGQPLLLDAPAWIDCAVHNIMEIGDHYLVVGVVEALGRADHVTPLLFFGGRFHHLADIVETPPA